MGRGQLRGDFDRSCTKSDFEVGEFALEGDNQGIWGGGYELLIELYGIWRRHEGAEA